jgi:hypothetical protein
VAACHLGDFCFHAPGDPALEIGVHGVVLRGQDVPARLRLLRNAVGVELLSVEQVEDGRMLLNLPMKRGGA